MIEIDETREEILDDEHRFKVLVCGRRWGKTHLAIAWLLDGYIPHDAQLWYVAPTYRQAKLIVWKKLKELLRSSNLHYKVNETELTIEFKNHLMISVKGADNEDSLRGVGLYKVVLDEYAFMKPNVWGEIFRPMLGDTGGTALFIGTPSGFNHFYDIYIKELTDNNWKSWFFKTVDGGYISQEEIEQARKDLDERTFRQEFEASFENYDGNAINNFSRDIVQVRNDISLRGQIIEFGIDFNVDWMTAELFIEINGTIHYFDEIRMPKNSNTFEIVDEIKRRYSGRFIAYPDASGSARKTSSTKSDHQIIRDAGIMVSTPHANPPVKDRVNTFLSMIKNKRISIDPKCVNLIRDCEIMTWKNGVLNEGSDHSLSHAFDAASYPIHYKYGIDRGQTSSKKWTA